MPNARVSIVLPPSLAALLADLSQESGESVSSLVRGMLVQSEPALARMLHLLRAANAAKGQIGQGLGGTMARVVDDLESAMLLADARMQRASADLVAQAETVQGRRRGGGSPGGARDTAPAVSTPVPVTRGSGRMRGGATRPALAPSSASIAKRKGVARGAV